MSRTVPTQIAVLSLLGCVISSPGVGAAPASIRFDANDPAQKRALQKPLPPSIGVWGQTNIVRLFNVVLSPEKGAREVLVSGWAAPRRNPSGGGMFGPPPGFYKGTVKREEGFADGLLPSPFVLDFFTPAPGKNRWNHARTLVFEDTRVPNAYSLSYLNAKTKTGLVLTSHTGFYRGHNSTVRVFPQGLNGPMIERTFTSYLYMNESDYNVESRDERGVTQVVLQEMLFLPRKGDEPLKYKYRTTTLRWNGKDFVLSGKPVMSDVK